ncbi:MAG: hypothetical protein J6M92_08080 [Oribacterium sp.]|nr:hypothetical protein [Oribacterium sp.]
MKNEMIKRRFFVFIFSLLIMSGLVMLTSCGRKDENVRIDIVSSNDIATDMKSDVAGLQSSWTDSDESSKDTESEASKVPAVEKTDETGSVKSVFDNSDSIQVTADETYLIRKPDIGEAGKNIPVVESSDSEALVEDDGGIEDPGTDFEKHVITTASVSGNNGKASESASGELKSQVGGETDGVDDSKTEKDIKSQMTPTEVISPIQAVVTVHPTGTQTSTEIPLVVTRKPSATMVEASPTATIKPGNPTMTPVPTRRPVPTVTPYLTSTPVPTITKTVTKIVTNTPTPKPTSAPKPTATIKANTPTPSVHVHNWVDVTKTVHHEAKGYWLEAWDEDIYITTSQCRVCKKTSYDLGFDVYNLTTGEFISTDYQGFGRHCAVCGPEETAGLRGYRDYQEKVNTIHHEPEYFIYSNAHDETVPGSRCSECGEEVWAW